MPLSHFNGKKKQNTAGIVAVTTWGLGGPFFCLGFSSGSKK